MLPRFPIARARLLSSSSKIVSVSQPVNRIITVEWYDGMKGKFPVIWLRDCSLDPKTYSIGPAMTARKLTMNEFDVEQNPKSVRLENEELVIDWEETQSRFNSNWLRFRNPSDNGARKHRRQVYLFPEDTWGKSDIERRLKKFSHTAVLSDDKTLHDFLEAVCVDGIAVIKNAPKGSTNVVRDIGERIGLIHSTHFGKIFVVSTKPDASNMAYASNSGLPFHTDFPSLSDPPQLQMLHMIEKAKEGGNNLFVDGFHVAEQLRREKLDVFKVLTTSPIEFIEEGFDVHDGSDGRPSRFDYNMCSRHRTIKLDDSGRVVKIQFGNAMRSWFYDCEPEKIQEIYRALKTFTDYCYQDKNILKLALENGDTVLWANTRLLHRRDAFRNAPNVSRTLAGCYFSWDIVKSKVRLLRRRLELPCAQPSV
uniref:gamma-butyrobetaine dioxygenase n=1 Tax=Angiostrongylus cantonensis TaxID=6313 RepID=Q8MUC4_ANGCA|nr:gamma-butyrobetaine,2-oxoglutarate dioxygenase [Angiostrongylus cantonensis]